MMSTTHAFVGLLLASSMLFLAPEFAVVGAVAAMAGGVFPDLDLFVGEHRKTLHYPDYYWVAAAPAVAVAAFAPGPLTVGAAFFLVSAALHSASDALGGGLGLRPWEDTSDRRGVYLHSRRRWIPPRRWVRYDGAPEDLALAAAFALPGYLLFDGVVSQIVVAGLAVSVVYTAVRKRLPDLAPEFLQ
ncbi:metal-dependent hydrolase [Halobacteriaceae archaeon GCM10025711]